MLIRGGAESELLTCLLFSVSKSLAVGQLEDHHDTQEIVIFINSGKWLNKYFPYDRLNTEHNAKVCNHGSLFNIKRLYKIYAIALSFCYIKFHV